MDCRWGRGEAGIGMFQFPFRRDELCNPDYTAEIDKLLDEFQFPFRRDELCNADALGPIMSFTDVSIPFSSG